MKRVTAQDTRYLHRLSLNVDHARHDSEYSMKSKTDTNNKTDILGDRP